MHLNRLLPELPPGYTPIDVPVSIASIIAFHQRLLYGITGRERRILVGDDEVHPVVIEVASLEFSAQDLAGDFWRRRPSILRLASRMEPSVVSRFSGDLLSLKWSRGEVHFTEVAMLIRGSIFVATAADDSSVSSEQRLQGMLEQGSEHVPSTPASSRVSARGRRVIRRAVVAGVIVPAIFAGQLIPGSSSIIAVFLIAYGVSIIFVPFALVRRNMRRIMEQGDTDGMIRSALASRGISLP